MDSYELLLFAARKLDEMVVSAAQQSQLFAGPDVPSIPASSSTEVLTTPGHSTLPNSRRLGQLGLVVTVPP